MHPPSAAIRRVVCHDILQAAQPTLLSCGFYLLACLHRLEPVLLASHRAPSAHPLHVLRTKPTGKHFPERRQSVGGQRKGGGEDRDGF